jgi:hypothetical protein
VALISNDTIVFLSTVVMLVSAAACGRDAGPSSSTPVPTEASASVSAFIEDVNAIKALADSYGVTSAQIIDLINEAANSGDADRVESELPGLLDALLTKSAATQAAISAYDPQTEAGLRVKATMLGTARRQQKLAEDLADRLAAGGRVWGPLLDYGKGINGERERLATELEAIVNSLPPKDRQVIDELAGVG